MVNSYKVKIVKKGLRKFGFGFYLLFIWFLTLSGLIMGVFFIFYSLFPLTIVLTNSLLIGISILIIALVIMSSYYYVQMKKNVRETKILFH